MCSKEEARDLYEQLSELGLTPAWVDKATFITLTREGKMPIHCHAVHTGGDGRLARVPVQFTVRLERAGVRYTALKQITDKLLTEVFYAGMAQAREDTLDAISTALGLPTASDRRNEKAEIEELERRIEKLENQ